MQSSQRRKPFLKWAGAKTKVMAVLGPLLPATEGKFIEPFVGSGAVFVNTDYKSNLLTDSNPDVIALYQALRECGESFIDECRTLFTPQMNSREAFQQLRSEFNSSCDALRRSALFLYLNRHCFNGLCRYNASGQFNTPFGRYSSVGFPDESIKLFAQKLQTAELAACDFSAALSRAESGDVVYCDPPYAPLSATANFTSYAAGGFSLKDQVELKEKCVTAFRRGATVIVSNHDTPFTRDLYADATQIVELTVERRISCDAANRSRAHELIAVYGARPTREQQLQLLNLDAQKSLPRDIDLVNKCGNKEEVRCHGIRKTPSETLVAGERLS